ncbi:MAG: Transcriptional regulator, TetR family [Blastococcus sp.]|nr:Transcriptional regulator, TetR family [Blastococcus sp.]
MTVRARSAGSSAPRLAPKRCRNRPLDRAKDDAITAAVQDVLARMGYSGLTMDEVAVVAGVGKAAIYRRWTSKEDLLVSFIQESIVDVLVVDTGSLRSDMIVLLKSVVEHMEGLAGRAHRALLSAVHDDPVLAEAFHGGPLARWSGAFAAVFDRAVERGEIVPGAGTSVAAEAGPAILMQRWLLGGAALDEALVTAVVDEVMLPLLLPEDRRSTRHDRTTPGRTPRFGSITWISSTSPVRRPTSRDRAAAFAAAGRGVTQSALVSPHRSR